MFKPVTMLKANIVILAKYREVLSQKLGEFGLIHLMNAPQQYNGEVGDLSHGAEMSTLNTDISRIEKLIEHLDLEQDTTDVELPEILSEVQIREEVDALEKELDALKTKANLYVQEAEQLKEKQQILTGFPMQKVPLRELKSLSYLHAVYGELPSLAIPELQNQFGDRMIFLHVNGQQPTVQNVLILTTKRDYWELEDFLKEHLFTERVFPADSEKSAEEELSETEKKLVDIYEALQDISRQRTMLAVKNGKMLKGLLTLYRRKQQILEAESNFGMTQNLCCVCGWIPAAKSEELVRLVLRFTDETGAVQFVAPENDPAVQCGKEQVPVCFSGGKFAKPFEFLIKVYGTPRYDEVEPTIFFALSFVLMFSVMFGDVGQGAIIALLGQGLAHWRSQRLDDEIRGFGWLLTFCGLGSVVMGLIIGSFFGFEPHHYPRLIHPQEDTMLLFGIAIGVGIVCLSISMIINVINKLKNRHYFDAFLDKAGIAGIVFYWGCIGCGTYAAISGRIHGWQIGLIVLPILFIVIREPLQNLILRKKKLLHEGAGIFVMEAALESFEIVNGFFSNTLSFIRVGAFAISHAVMCSLIYMMLDGIRSTDVGSSLLKLLIIILGNILIIVVEGMVVSIQSMRLQLYELFSKYFAGDGLEYKPFAFDKEKK